MADLSAGAIVGMVVGCLLGGCILIAILLHCCKKKIQGSTKGSQNSKRLDGKVVVITGTFQCITLLVVLLVVFSARGGRRTDKRVLTAYFPVPALGILGKGVLFVVPPLADCLTGLTGSSTQLEQVVPIYTAYR